MLRRRSLQPDQIHPDIDHDNPPGLLPRLFRNLHRSHPDGTVLQPSKSPRKRPRETLKYRLPKGPERSNPVRLRKEQVLRWQVDRRRRRPGGIIGEPLRSDVPSSEDPLRHGEGQAGVQLDWVRSPEIQDSLDRDAPVVVPHGLDRCHVPVGATD